jgi:very-short-patch-repair endonuclease
MIFTIDQISSVIKEIDKNILVYIGVNLGQDVLSVEDRKLLESFNINPDELSDEFPYYYRMFLLGKLTQLIGDFNALGLDYSDFDKYLKRKQYNPLTSFEKLQYELARNTTYSHLKNLGNRMRVDTQNSIIENLTRVEYEKIIKEEIEEGILQRKMVSGVVSDIGHRTGDWSKDLGRIVETEGNNIFQRGRATEIQKMSGKRDPLVYKDVFPGACRHCIRLYLTKGIGSKPILFRLSQLIANGSNIGRKVENWKPSLESTHPFCFANARTPIYTSTGYKYIKDIQVGDLVLTHKKRFRRVTSLSFTKRSIEGTYTITCQLKNKDRKIFLVNITADHPVLTEHNGWVKTSDLKVGQKLLLLHDKCSYSRCNKEYPIYYKDDSDYSKVDHCSVSCKSFDKSQKRTKEERNNLTKNARQTCFNKYPNNTSPFFSIESKKKANSTNGKKCSYIELKLRHFLDKLNIEYLVDFSIKRKETKINGQNRVYFPDIYIPSLNIILEADGINWHEDKEADRKRDSEIKELIGADVFRFSEDDIRNRGEKVFNEIHRIVKNHRGEYSLHQVEIVDLTFKKSRYRETSLYNFSVEEDESYIANGIVVHNCRCNLRHVDDGMIWDQDEQKFVYDKKQLDKEEKKLGDVGKIVIMVGDKKIVV